MPAMEGVRWAFSCGTWLPSRAEWLLAVRSIQPEEKERIGQFVFARDAKAAMVLQVWRAGGGRARVAAAGGRGPPGTAYTCGPGGRASARTAPTPWEPRGRGGGDAGGDAAARPTARGLHHAGPGLSDLHLTSARVMHLPVRCCSLHILRRSARGRPSEFLMAPLCLALHAAQLGEA